MKDTAKEAGEATKEGAKKTGDATAEGAKKTAEAAKAGTATATAATKAGATKTADAFRGGVCAPECRLARSDPDSAYTNSNAPGWRYSRARIRATSNKTASPPQK